MDEPSDLTDLRQRFPEWYFGAEWTTAATGPDRRRLWAVKEGTTYTAWSAAALAMDIERAEAGE
jgi:hypothetical protein